MTAFSVGKPVSSRVPQVTVDGTLAPGRHLFELVVRDDAGNASEPARAVVVVGEGRRPPGPVVRPDTPVFEAVEPRFVTTSPRPVAPKRPAGPG